MGDSPSRFWPGDPDVRRAYWDRLLYSAYELTVRRTGRDVSYTHIFNGHYENLDHILVSQEFHERNPQRIAEVMNLRYFNDHLVDSQLSNDRHGRTMSDHAQLVAEIRLLRFSHLVPRSSEVSTNAAAAIAPMRCGLTVTRSRARQRPSRAWPRSAGARRSEERRVGKECRSRWSPYH